MRCYKVAIYFLFLVLTSCGHQSKGEKITIAAASNMQYAMNELSRSFTQNTGIACDLIFGSSGKLTAQIKEGAPYDIFVAADMKYPEEVFKMGMADDRPKTYALGKLVLWTMKEELEPSIIILEDEAVVNIALANPKTAPYGAAALAVLEYHEMYEGVLDKLVYGESISQTNQFITSKSAEIGFTSMSVVLSPQLRSKGRWVPIDPNLHPALRQGVVVLKHKTGNLVGAEKFYNFLFSREAKQILKDFGYSVDE